MDEYHYVDGFSEKTNTLMPCSLLIRKQIGVSVLMAMCK
jgi:hypothetical protein